MNTKQLALDALKLLDPDLKFKDWENGDGDEIGDQLRSAATALEADIAGFSDPINVHAEKEITYAQAAAWVRREAPHCVVEALRHLLQLDCLEAKLIAKLMDAACELTSQLPVFTTTQTPSTPTGERGSLIASLRGCADSYTPGYIDDICKAAADMLAADDLRTQLARRTVERDMALSMAVSSVDVQQVVVPQGWKLVPESPTLEMTVALMCTGLRHAEYRKGFSPTITNLTEGYSAMLAAAPQPPHGVRP